VVHAGVDDVDEDGGRGRDPRNGIFDGGELGDDFRGLVTENERSGRSGERGGKGGHLVHLGDGRILGRKRVSVETDAAHP
jgi:hypothetical protein